MHHNSGAVDDKAQRTVQWQNSNNCMQYRNQMVARPQFCQLSPRRGANATAAMLTLGLTCLLFADDGLHAEPVAAILPEQTPFESISAPVEVIKNHASDNTGSQREFSSVIKEAVRPTYQELADSGLIDSVRSLGSELGLIHPRSLGSESSTSTGNSESDSHRKSNDWATSGKNPSAAGQVRSAQEIERDQLMAKTMLKELVAEVSPWVFALIGLYALGYAVKLLLDFRRWKLALRRKRSSGGKHRRHHRHSGHSSISSTLDHAPVKTPSASSSSIKN